MSQWATKRKTLYLSIFLGVVLLFLALIIIPRLQTNPTCSDGVQNGAETGVDCGGSCALFCDVSALPLSTLWTRSFEVIPGRYNAVSLVENQNTETAISAISYEFRLYDESNVFIARRSGETFILPNNRTPIFESAILVGNRAVARTEFSFTETPLWLQIPKDSIKNPPSVSASTITMKDPFTNPTLTATIKNNSSFRISDFDVVAVLYNQTGNVIAVSTTFVESLDAGKESQVFYSWQKSFTEEPVKIELIPKINIYQIDSYRSK